jgi:hypothetical protein
MFGDGKISAAVQDVPDGQHTLEGEDPFSRQPEDAVHWRYIYTELVGLKEHAIVVREAMSRRGTAGPGSEPELDMMRVARDRARRRLVFWTRRCQELGLR